MDALGIANKALRRLGQAPITALNEDSTASRALQEQFAASIDEVTSEHDWTFARTRALLVLDSVSDNFTPYEYMYAEPADSLAIREVFQTAGQGVQYEIEGEKIVTDYEDAYCRYTRSIVDLTDPANPAIETGVTLPPKFARACALKLAEYALPDLKGKATEKRKIETEYFIALAQAKNQDAMESPGLDEDVERWEEIV